jgi:hypothetical protein
VSIARPAYAYRDWTNVIPAADGEELKFVLYPVEQRSRRAGRERPMDSRLIVGLPAPAPQVESWVRLSQPGGAPPRFDGGRKSLVLFTAAFDNRHRFPGTIKDWLLKLEQNAAKLDAQPVVIFTPHTHASGIRALLKEVNIQAAVGIDQFLPLAATDHDGATRTAFGGDGTTRVFLVGADSTVLSDHFDLETGK